MNKIQKRLGIAVLAPFAIALFIWLGGELVMHLWNWLAPTLFGWRQITFWQALDCWLSAAFSSGAMVFAPLNAPT